jgi:hypothetical protein
MFCFAFLYFRSDIYEGDMEYLTYGFFHTHLKLLCWGI